MNPTEEDRQDIRDAALDAQRLHSDPAFARFILEIRKTAVRDLIAADSNDIETNLRLRAEIKAIDALSGEIAFAMERGRQLDRNPRGPG